MKIAILGSTGYIGTAFKFAAENTPRPKNTEFAPSAYEVISLTSKEQDCTDYRGMKLLLGNLKPDFIVNAAGYTGKPNVDACEKHKGDTILGNVVLPLTVAQVCESLDIPWGHVSSGCVYTGFDKAFHEDDPPNFGFNDPSYSFYSGTKAMAEDLLVSQFPNTFIWRLRIPFDDVDSPRNYLTKLMKYDKLLDATNSISHRLDFVDACLDLAEVAPPGIYNVVNPGAVTTKEVVEMIKSKLNLDKQFEFYNDESSFLQNVQTPRSNCTLTTTKLLKYGGMRSAKDALNDALDNWKVAE